MVKNLFDDAKTEDLDELDLRVYTSNLLGSDQDLVLHGGGNTSLKLDDILYVKGSGWDLSTIKKQGFAPVKMDTLLKMAQKDSLSDSDMVKEQREAMLNKDAPNPSVEAILHAIIPFKYVDHTHADAVVTISNSINGKKIIKDLFRDFLIVDYVMPGFILAKRVYELTKEFNWEESKGIILLNHGIFTFDDDAKSSYTKMIDAVNLAEEFLDKNANLDLKKLTPKSFNVEGLKTIIEKRKSKEIFLNINQSDLALNYSNADNLKSFASRGVLTPEHIIRTKRSPLVIEDLDGDIDSMVDEYIAWYERYFEEFSDGEIMLNPAPNYAVIKGFGVVSFGGSQKEADIINDIVLHTMKAVMRADMLGGYESISLKDSFDMEYWELEQAKLRSK